jgi:PAS domain S-box-containing protein
MSDRKKAGDAIRGARDTLEMRVEERTAELLEANEKLEQEIEERKRTEEALKQSDAEKRVILDASIDRIRYVDRDMRIIWANKAMAAALDMDPEDLTGRICYEVLVGRDAPCEGCPTVRVLKTGRIERTVEHHLKMKGVEGESYWDTYSVPLKNEAGEIVRFVQVTRNITDQKRSHEQVRTLTRQLLSAQENERRMISRELHDSIAQDLSSLIMNWEKLLRDLQDLPDEAKKRVSESSAILKKAIASIRDLSYLLRPPTMDRLGIVQSIASFCEDFSDKTGIDVEFTPTGLSDISVDSDTEINLYRLVQEGLNNIGRHAKAKHATVKMVMSHPSIILRIVDDGRGFDVEKRLAALTEEKRMGLRSMEERVRLLGGQMEVKSHMGKGTNILIEVPFVEKERGTKETHNHHR